MTEKEPQNIKPSSMANAPSSQTMMMAWQAANFTTLVALTSGLIAIVHSPLNSMMLNQMISGRLLQMSSDSRLSFLVLMRQFYTGFGACFAGTGTRTAYMSGAKKADQYSKTNFENLNREEMSEDQAKALKNINRSTPYTLESLGYTAAMAMGELIVCIVPESISHLRKLNIVPPEFIWRTPYNVTKLSVTSAGARFGFGFVNFLCLCEAEQFYARHLPIDDYTKKHFVAGALGGATAAISSYPFSLYRDYHLSKMRIENQKLISPGTWNLFKEYATHIKNIGFCSAFKSHLNDFLVQAPLRVLRTSSRFAIIAGVAAKLNNEPLTTLIENKQISGLLTSLGLFPKQKTSEINEPKPPQPTVF